MEENFLANNDIRNILNFIQEIQDTNTFMVYCSKDNVKRFFTLYNPKYSGFKITLEIPDFEYLENLEVDIYSGQDSEHYIATTTLKEFNFENCPFGKYYGLVDFSEIRDYMAWYSSDDE